MRRCVRRSHYTLKLLLGIPLVFAALIISQHVHADPNQLLGTAIQNADRLNGSLPTKERLAAYGSIFEALDRIVAEHPSSNQAITILSGQQVGNFDPPALRNAYITELTQYYDTVCEASPSYSCLGFVSLKIGNEQCETASSFEEIVEAHSSLRNAARVFIGQEDSKSYISLAMGSYRGCLRRSRFESTAFASDYFASELLDMLLESDQASVARASIEDMGTPYFKFLGALKLSGYEERPFDQSFWDRMKKYIKERIPDEDGDAAMANLALMLNAVQRSSLPIDYGSAYGAVQDYRGWGRYARSCDHLFSRTLFDVLSTLQAELVGLNESRKEFNSAQAPMVMTAFAERPKGPLSACKTDGLYDYYLMTYLHGQLLIDDPMAAAEFKRRASKGFLSDRAQLRFFFDHFGETPAKLDLINGTAILRRDDAKYFVLEKRVNFGDVCEAARILFQDLKDGGDFDLAIEYMISSPRLDPSVKYDCGDEDLELLLR